MIEGASYTFWIWFHIAVVLVLCIDFFGVQRKGSSGIAAYAIWTGILVLLSLGLAGFFFFERGHQAALEFVSGYAIELSLSIDNLFVFLLLFGAFGLSLRDQRNALTFGVIGAIVMRGLFVVVGVSLIERFAAVQYVFGAILLFGAWRLLAQKEKRHGKPAWIKWLMRGDSPRKPVLLMAIIAIEITDLVFALDSVPAVIAVSHEPFIIYTSNICAVLGLRSLYFVLAGMLNRLRLLHYGLGIILGFVGLKMILAHWVTIPVSISLAVIIVTVTVFTIASLRNEA